MSKEIDELRKLETRRRLVVVAAVAAFALWLWWAWTERDRGEPELAHRVLIVGGTPTDLVAVIAEAGFDATQITWDDARTQCADEQGNFDAATVIDHADEHGYGFVALMLDEDMPLERTILGESAPDHAMAAVLSIGDLAPQGSRVAFGGPPEPLEYVPGLRRSEGLRMGLYEHPDLLALWDDPSSDQLAQRVHLGDLDKARTLLDGALARYESAIEVWQREQPTWSEARLVRRGRLVRELSLTLRAVEGRKVEMERPEDRVYFESEQGESQAMPNEVLDRWRVAPDGAVGLLETGNEWQRWRFDRELPVREGEVDPTTDHPTFSSEGSLMGFGWSELRWTTVLGRQGTLAMDPAFMPGNRVVPAWLDDEIAILAGIHIDDVDWLALLELGHPDGPRLVTLRTAELLSPIPGTEPTAISLHPTRAGLYVVISQLEHPAETADYLFRVEFDAAELRAAMSPVAGEPATLDDAAVSSAARSWSQLGEPTKVVELRRLPHTVPGSLTVAPDGTWLAGRSTAVGTIWAAAIVGNALAESVELGESLSDPQISADSQSLLLTVERELEFGTVRRPSLVPRPSP